MDRIANLKFTVVELKQKLKELTGKPAYGNKNELARMLATAAANVETTTPPSPVTTIQSTLTNATEAMHPVSVTDTTFSHAIRPSNTRRKRVTSEADHDYIQDEEEDEESSGLVVRRGHDDTDDELNEVNFNDLVDGGGGVGASTSTSTSSSTSSTTTTTSTAVTITTTTTTKKNPRGKGKLYEPYCCLKSIEAADQILSKQQWEGGYWLKEKQVPGRHGVAIFYSCKHKKCTLSIKLFLPNLSERCTLFVEAKAGDKRPFAELHQHGNDKTDDDEDGSGIPEAIKAKLIEYESLHVRPMTMLEQLRKANIVPPTFRQLNNFLCYYRKKQLGGNTHCLQDCVDWAEKHSSKPADDDKAYVSNYMYETLPNRKFRCFIATTRLIGWTQHVSVHIHV